MSWPALLALAAAIYAMKAIGPVFAGDRQLGGPLQQALDVIAYPLLAALIVVGAFDGGRELVLDARLPALAVAAVLIWRRVPFPIVIVAAAVTAALLRHL